MYIKEYILFGIIDPVKKLSVLKTFHKTRLYFACIIFLIFLFPCFGTDSELQLTPEEQAWINEDHTVRVRIGSAPPLMLTDGEIRGIAIDYLTYIFNRNGIKFSYVLESEVTWPQALKYIEQHDVVDMVPTAKITDERKKHMIFTNEYIVAPLVIFTRTDANFISSIDDLEGKTVSVEEGYVIHELLKREYPKINLKVVSADLDTNFAEIPIRDLSTGLVNAYIGNLITTTYMIQTKGYTNIKVAAPTPFDNHNQAMAIRNDWPELASIINKTLASMTSDEQAAISNKWLSIRYEYGISKVDILKWVFGVSGIALLFIAFVLISNKRLKTEVVFRKKAEKELKENLLLLDYANEKLKGDITERKRTVEEIKKSQILLQQAEEISNQGAWEWDIVHDEWMFSENWLRIHGCQLSGISREELMTIAYPEDSAAVDKAIQDALNGNKPYNIEHRIVRQNDGEVRYVRAKGSIILNDSGQPVKIYGVAQDITERKQDEEKVHQLQNQLAQSQKMDSIGQLAGGMAHDFNNVLNGIMSASQLLQLPKNGLNEKALKYVDMITKSAIRAADLISKLLAFSRKGKIVTSTLDIHEILNDVIAILEGTIDKKISISVTNDATNHQFIGDLSTIESTFLNLGINASHAMLNGGEIQIKTKNIFLDQKYCDLCPFEITPGEYLEIGIKDSGCGIPKENLQKIFEPFFTTKEQGKGTGLGLSAVYGTIQDHHGSIEVHSEEGSGTTFHILLPCSKQYIESVKEKGQILTGTGTILLVDDEEVNRILNKDIFESLGYKVLLAENGQVATEIYSKKHSEIDIVLLDMIMPKMNGSEAFLKMKEIDENCKVIIASGHTKDQNIDGLMQKGLAGFINKPYQISDISQLLDDVLNS